MISDLAVRVKDGIATKGKKSRGNGRGRVLQEDINIDNKDII
jgi:hypothetical protein